MAGRPATASELAAIAGKNNYTGGNSSAAPTSSGRQATPAELQAIKDQTNTNTPTTQYTGNQPTPQNNNGNNTSTPNQSSTASPTPYFPRSVSPDSTFSTALSNANPTATPTPEDFFSKVYSQLSPVLDAINQSEANAETNANIQATKDTSAMNAGLNARGLAGSSEGNAMASEVEQTRAAAIQKAQADRASAIGQTVEWAIPEAYNEYKDALTRNDTLSQNYVATKLKQATDSVKSIAAQGVSLDEFQKSNPDQYNQLLQYFNSDENLLKATYISGIPASQMIGDPIYNGTQATFLYLDPITKQYKSSTIDTGTNLDGKNTVTKVVPGVGVVVVDQNTGAAQVIGGTSNPYYMANQQLNVQTKLQRLENSKALEAVKLVGSQISKDAAITNFEAVSPIMDRINSAMNEINSGNLNEANAGALLDDITKLNTQGQAITGGQVDLTKSSLSFQDQAKVLSQKISGQGGVIDPKVAKDIYKLAEDNYKLYNNAFKSHMQTYANRLKNTPSGDLSGYLPITDISQISGTLPSIQDGSYASSLQATLGGTTDTTGSDTSGSANSGDVIDVGGVQYTVGADGETLTPQ